MFCLSVGSTILVARACVLVRALLVALVVFAGLARTLFVAIRLDILPPFQFYLLASDSA